VYQNGSLAYILTDKGRLVPDSTGFTYEYFIKDHLGNTRVTVKDSLGFAAIQQETHYYPFGMKMEGLFYQNTTQNNVNKILYQGQEIQDELDLGWYQFKWRMYNPEIGKFMSVDPLAEKYYYNSTYAFSENKVINAVELEGLEARIIVESGNYLLGNVGHTFVSIGSGENTKVFTYGRYAELEKDKGSLNSSNLNGEGVLIRLEGKEAINFTEHYVNDNDANVYEFTKVDESVVETFFENKFNSTKQKPTTGPFKNDERARVIDTYNLSDNNCTTKSLEAIVKGNGGIITYKKELKNNPKLVGNSKITMHIISTSPLGLNNQLKEATQDNKSGILNKTDEFKIKR
jgi:RHS repeat-associated protein